MIAALAGGVGAAKFLECLVPLIEPGDLTIVCNTGDDMTLWGLYLSPDVDIILYTLAGIVDPVKGWGVRGDTFNTLAMMRQYGLPDWFNLGDRDLATHIYRTALRHTGKTPSEITETLRRGLGVIARVLPMTDDPFETHVLTDSGRMHFQEYLVQRRALDTVQEVIYHTPLGARPAPGVLEAIAQADGVILCPSNPLASIGPILSLAGVRDHLCATPAPVLAISPIVGGKTLKGPADRMMAGIGLETSARQVAFLYQDFLDIFVLDQTDADLQGDIEALGVSVLVTDTIMNTPEKKTDLAKVVLRALND
ncbi:MAG: 2-phospho-L-lactate transferase [Acidobacteria bacterium]|nr:2-phospho-L-lactate transferase [Acidobacteriota bacterium]MBI3657183.1 2-phospho-L-lactate transferase [Acidobacteriota bacterium]